MSVVIVVGGQYGSESKGKCAVRLAQRYGCDLAVRTGGCNAGHTTFPNEHKFVTRTLPAPLAVPGVKLALGAGGMVDINLLEREFDQLESFGITDIRDRLWIDPFTSIVEDDASEREIQRELGKNIGSTQTGVGWTQSQRVLRVSRSAKDSGILKPFIHDVTKEINDIHDRGGTVIIEGTQGFGLSMIHGGCFPSSTSRDTSASGFASEAGVSPRIVDQIWMVIRTFPIRVGGNSGPMHEETTWDKIKEYCGCPNDLTEMTSVTKKVRRVGLFDWDLLARAVMVNRPTRIVVACLDYLNWKNRDVTEYDKLDSRAKTLISEIEDRTGVKVGQVFTGPKQSSLIDLD